MALLLMNTRPFISATSTRAVAAARNHLRRFVEVRGNAEVAREMIERSQGQDAEDGVGAHQRRGGGADRPVAAADDQQRVATLRNRLAAHRAIAALDKLDLTIHAGLGQRRRDLVGDFRIRRDRSAAAVEQDGRRHLGGLRRADAESGELVAVEVAEIGAVERLLSLVAANPRRAFA